MGCCASQGVSVDEDSFEGVDQPGGGGAAAPQSQGGQSTADDYEMFLKMKAAALQEKGMLSERVPNQSTELGRRSGNICDARGVSRHERQGGLRG